MQCTLIQMSNQKTSWLRPQLIKYLETMACYQTQTKSPLHQPKLTGNRLKSHLKIQFEIETEMIKASQLLMAVKLTVAHQAQIPKFKIKSEK